MSFGGRCYEGEGAPPYWPWVQILRASLEDADQERIWVDMGQAAADMATMLPELRNKWPDLDTPPVLDPVASRNSPTSCWLSPTILIRWNP